MVAADIPIRPGMSALSEGERYRTQFGISPFRFSLYPHSDEGEIMPIILWLLGVPVSLIVLLWLFGVVHF